MKGPEGIYTVRTEKKQRMIVHLFDEDDRYKEQKILFSIPVMIMSSISKEHIKHNKDNFVHFMIEEESLFGNVSIYCTIDAIVVDGGEESEIPTALCYIYPLESRWDVHPYIKTIDETLRENQLKLGEYIKTNYKLNPELVDNLRADPKIADLMLSTNEKIKLEIIEPKLGHELRKITIKL